MKILLVDDSKKHRLTGVADLTALGHEVVALSDYSEVQDAVRNNAFDVALLDLLMPAEAMTLGGKGLEHLGESFAVGFPLAVYLAISGIRFVAVATDTNHHHHPASALMDWFHEKTITINGSAVKYLHAPMKEVDDKLVKDWPEVLKRVLNQKE